MDLHVRLERGKPEVTSRIGENGHIVGNDSPPLQHFSKGAVLQRWATGPRKHVTLFSTIQQM